jgi:tetratricopeptide (TPR) repeat protein
MKQSEVHPTNINSQQNTAALIRVYKQVFLVRNRITLILFGTSTLLFSSIIYPQSRYEALLEERLAEIDTDPTNASLLNEIGSIYESIADYKVSMRHFESMSYYKAALSYYKTTFKVDPSLKSGISLKKDVERVLHKLHQTGFQDEIQLPPIILTPSEKDVASALEKLRVNPNDLDAAYTMALHYYINKEYNSAIIEYLKIAKATPNPDIYYTIGDVYSKMNEYQKAITFYQKSIRLKPDIIRVYSGIGNAYYQLGKYDHAIVYCLLADGIAREEYGFILAPLAVAYLKRGKLEHAEQIATKVIAKDTTYAEAYYVLGSVLYEKMNFQESEKYLRFYLKQSPKGEYASEVERTLKELAKSPKLTKSSKDAEVYRFPEWNFELRADLMWHPQNMALLREMFGQEAAGAILLLEKSNSDLMVSVTITDLIFYPEVKTPEDYAELVKKFRPDEVSHVVEPLKGFKLNGYIGAKRVYTMSGMATIIGYTFIKDGKAYLVGGQDMSATRALNPEEFRSRFAQNRKELEKVMNTFRFLDVSGNELADLFRNKPSFMKVVWGLVWQIPLYTVFGSIDWIPLFLSIFWLALWNRIMFAPMYYGQESPGCLLAIAPFAQLFYLFCCIRALF